MNVAVSPPGVLSDPVAQAPGLHLHIPVPEKPTPHFSGGKTKVALDMTGHKGG